MFSCYLLGSLHLIDSPPVRDSIFHHAPASDRLFIRGVYHCANSLWLSISSGTSHCFGVRVMMNMTSPPQRTFSSLVALKSMYSCKHIMKEVTAITFSYEDRRLILPYSFHTSYCTGSLLFVDTTVPDSPSCISLSHSGSHTCRLLLINVLQLSQILPLRDDRTFWTTKNINLLVLENINKIGRSAYWFRSMCCHMGYQDPVSVVIMRKYTRAFPSSSLFSQVLPRERVTKNPMKTAYKIIRVQ